MGKGFGFFTNDKGKPSFIVLPYGGMTTDRAIFSPIAVLFSFAGRSGHYIIDPKFYLNPERHQNTLYQEISVGLTKDGRAGSFVRSGYKS